MGRTLAIDIETYSDVDLISCGVYKYSSSPYFEILLIAYSVDDKETVCIDVANGEEPPKEFMEMLFDDTVTKTAFNANFERTCFSNYYQHSFRPEAWRCTAVQAAMLALPLSLEGVGAVLGLDKQKMTEGKELIKYFAARVKPQNQMEEEQEICRKMHRKNGDSLKHIVFGMLMWKNKYGRDWLSFLSEKGAGNLLSGSENK